MSLEDNFIQTNSESTDRNNNQEIYSREEIHKLILNFSSGKKEQIITLQEKF